MRTPTRLVALAVLAAGAAVPSLAGPPVSAGPLDPPERCTNVESDIGLGGCAVRGAITHAVRHPCDYAYLPTCDLAKFYDPGYRVTSDPSPGAPLDWKVGAVHEHSGYSDGDIDSVPRDYFRAARTGINGTGTGVQLDFLFSSEHSDNSQITPTTNAECLTGGPARTVACAHLTDNTFWWKWPSALRQAEESTTEDFTAIRGFEWTNDFYNHMNVYFSTNFRNVKIDGSYLTMERMWSWLQKPVHRGGGADALVTFNHPGSNPKLSPFDGDLPHSELLGETTLDNWNEVAYVPEVADRVVGMEVNGGEDIEWFVKALQNGWRLGPVAAEDHHQTSWADVEDHKTMILTRGTDPQDYYWAFANRRTIAIHADLVEGAPGTPADVPQIDFTADKRHVLGSVVRRSAKHSLRVAVDGLPAGFRVALIGSPDGQAAPVQLGTVDSDGALEASATVRPTGPEWWFAVVCGPATEDAPGACGSNQLYSALTAPIWFE